MTGDRPSNVQRRPDAGAVALTISDGPSSQRVGHANLYEIGEPVLLRAETIGLPSGAKVTCLLLSPTGTKTDLKVADGVAEARAEEPGDHWYAFDVVSADGRVLASREKHFVVRARRVPR